MTSPATLIRSLRGAAILLALPIVSIPALAQPLGTFRWQLQPFCNVVTVAVTQIGAVYRLEGTDDQCGSGADAASVTGTAFPNADGTIGFGLNIVTAPGGRPVHVDAEINIGSFSGTWRDSAGGAGTFALTPGAGTGGSPRPLPAPTVPTTIQLRADGGLVATGSVGQGTIPASGPGARMMWFPGKAAFRVGVADGAEWDDANVGERSVATGVGARASGFASTAMGFGTTASDEGSTAIGFNTTASGRYSLATGQLTRASGRLSTAIGSSTTATGEASTAMGSSTHASGTASTAIGQSSVAAGDAAIAAGFNVTASGNGSVVLGSRATSTFNAVGSFVFGDRSSSSSVLATAPGQFVVRAAGGVYFSTNSALSTGVQLNPGSSQWLSLSDVHTKHRFRELDGNDVLARIARMPVTEWSYKAQDGTIRHIGPTAQDFHAAFGLGEDPLRIGTLDADGVALAGVKALEARTHDLPDRLRTLEAENTGLQADLQAARARLASLVDANTALQARLARLERLLGHQ